MTLLARLTELAAPVAAQATLVVEHEEVERSTPLADLTAPPLAVDFFKTACDARDRVPELSRLSHEDEYVHVSSLVDMCARQYAIARQTQTVVENPLHGGNQVVFSMGLAAERHVVAQLAAYHGTDRVRVGEEYRDGEYMVIGRPDAMVNVVEDLNAVVEVKSMNGRDWQALTRPRADHVLQAAIYRWLALRHMAGGRVHPTVALLYVSKEYVHGSPYKEFHVNADDESAARMLDTALQLAAELRDAQAEGSIPPREVCDAVTCGRARTCPVAALCFNLPAEGTQWRNRE